MRNRDYHRGDGHTPDRIEMLRVSRLNRRSIRRDRSFAAAQLIRRSIARTIRAAACRRGARHRGRSVQANWEQESDEEYGQEAHDAYFNRSAQNGQ